MRRYPEYKDSGIGVDWGRYRRIGKRIVSYDITSVNESSGGSFGGNDE